MKLTKEKRNYILKVIDSCNNNDQCQTIINWLNFLIRKSKRHKDIIFLLKNIRKCIDFGEYHIKMKIYKEGEKDEI